jgi:hypothetical protein
VALSLQILGCSDAKYSLFWRRPCRIAERIEEAGYEEQAGSYRLMAQASSDAANAADKAANGDNIAALIKGAAGVASLFMTTA